MDRIPRKVEKVAAREQYPEEDNEVYGWKALIETWRREEGIAGSVGRRRTGIRGSLFFVQL